MIIGTAETKGREVRCERIDADLVVVGGGMTGVAAAITAARGGTRVVLIQDRPVLGGNASSEVRLWVLGATSHMGNNNRWAREGGVIDEILVENMYRNREGNPVLLDALLLDKVLAEKNIRLLLNTVVTDACKSDGRTIASVEAFNPQNATRYRVAAPLFCDASGDGIVAYLCGASYRFGAEDRQLFGEGFSPSEQYGELLGHTIYFYTRFTDRPVRFTAPDFALREISVIPKYRNIRPDQWGCNYWWFEYGGKLDTVHDTERIKYELWRIVYGAWDYIKNSGRYPEAENMTLEWVGTIPGKRESRRFEGLYMLRQQDIVEQTRFEDAVSYGGWAVDLHPADGVYSPLPSCNQYHSKGIYSIPYRCFVSRDIDNLFLAGRLMSASHVAFGSTRVMATAAHGGQAVGMAASLCRTHRCRPADLLEPRRMRELQQRLNLAGQSIPFVPISRKGNLAAEARIAASSSLSLGLIPFSSRWIRLDHSAAQLLPLKKGTAYSFRVLLKADAPTEIAAELYVARNPHNYTPDRLVQRRILRLSEGRQQVDIAFERSVPEDQYGFVVFRSNPAVEIGASDFRYTGVLSLFNRFNLQVNNHGRQTPPAGSGFEEFEFWCPERRPGGHNIAMRIAPAIEDFGPENLLNGYIRPTVSSNAWAADPAEEAPELTLVWDAPRTVKRITLYLDNDYDHPMESSQYGHPEHIVPFCLREFRILDREGHTVAHVADNHATVVHCTPERPLTTDRLTIRAVRPSTEVPAAIFGIHIR
ncbi:FAD-dependent oxidoreductase [Alistipes sp.]|uniref:FAD-dependent oxidoreductase n=1 Tax=Alistipes sp. TaxID=1872444 RepID=UPI003AF04C2A